MRLLAFLCMATPTSAFCSAPERSGPFAINSVLSVDLSVTIVVSGNDNPVGCSNPSWLRIHPADANYSATVSTLLTAFSQGKQIKTWQQGDESDGTVHFTGVWIDR